MMKIKDGWKSSFWQVACFLFCTCTFLGFASSEPFLLLPEQMLQAPQAFTYKGTIGVVPTRGFYFIEPVINSSNSLIGYRNWQVCFNTHLKNPSIIFLTILSNFAQNYTSPFQSIFYGVSYFNNTYLQASINTIGQCNVFSEQVVCTGWTSSPMNSLSFSNSCGFLRSNGEARGLMKFTILANAENPTLLASSTAWVSTNGEQPSQITINVTQSIPPLMPNTDCGF